jgi:pterin-4a-carbinolamine dehydratase
VSEGSVSIRLQTKDIAEVTELDREYAKWTDELYKDVVYSPSHGRK